MGCAFSRIRRVAAMFGSMELRYRDLNHRVMAVSWSRNHRSPESIASNPVALDIDPNQQTLSPTDFAITIEGNIPGERPVSNYSELVDDFIGAAQLSLDAGFPGTAKCVLKTHWLQTTANDEQRQKLASLRTRTEADLRVEGQFGRGALINLNHEFAKNLYDDRHIPAEQIAAMHSFNEKQG